MQYDFSTIEACKMAILSILSAPVREEPSHERWAIWLDYGGAHFARYRPLSGKMHRQVDHFGKVDAFPGLSQVIFAKAVRELEEEKKLVPYKRFTHEDRGATLDYIVGIPEREAEFDPDSKRTAA